MVTQMQNKISKRLGELVDVDSNFADLSVHGLALDSRQVTVGDVFLAYPSYRVEKSLDGRNFIHQAITLGAVAVLVDRDEKWCEVSQVESVPIIPIERLNASVSAIADKFYNHPSQSIPVLGVTGTNGKTSCTQLMMQLFNQQHKRCGVIGTLGAGVDGVFDTAINTTPDAISIQRYLAYWRDENIDAVAMEVSSHGLEQHRVASICFTLALFTNLTRDHLDYHGSMQAYASAKSKLFTMPKLQIAVINIDDDLSTALINLLASDVKLVRYSALDTSADFFINNISFHQTGVTATLHCTDGQFDFSSPLLGAFNLHNLLGVLASLVSVGSEIEQLIAQIPLLTTVPGRMERVAEDTDISVVVDYAHTPDALEKALTAMRLHSAGKLWCVFGCGGDRDHGKRQQMGEVAQRCSDYVVVTSDNPRSESANAIIDDILCGIDIPTQVDVDRAAAIRFAITNAKSGDCVVIAGKGHEDYQHIGDKKIPFSDMSQAKMALTNRVSS